MKDQILRLGKGSLIYGTGTAINQFLSILMLPLFTAYLSPKDFGIIAVLTLVSFFLMAIFSLGFGTSIGITYFEGTEQNRKDQTIWTAFFALVFNAAVMFVFGWLFLDTLSNLVFDTPQYSNLVFLNLITTVFIIISIPFTLKLQFEDKPATYFWLTLIASLIAILINIVFVVVLEKGVEGMIEGILLGKIIYFLLFFISTTLASKIRFNFTLSLQLFKYGIPIVPGVISLYILQQGNVFSLEKFHSLEIAGLYAVGFGLGYAIQLLISGFSISWYPFYMSYMEKQEEGKEIFGKIFTYFLFGIGLISLLLYVFSKPIIMVFASSGYYEAYQVIGLTASAQLFLGLFNLLNAPIMLAKQPGYSTIFQVMATLAYIGILFILIPSYGLIGAGISLVLGYILLDVFVFTWNYFNKKYITIQYEYKKIIPFLLMYFLAVAFMMWDKNLSIGLEITASLFITLLLGLFSYYLFGQAEKQIIYKLFTLSFYKQQLDKLKNE